MLAGLGLMLRHDASFRAEVKSIDELLSLGSFRPASVQRALVWEPRQVLRLLGDVAAVAGVGSEAGPAVDDDDDDALLPLAADEPLAVREDPYVIGTVQLRRCEDGTYDIYDGLQRMTTLTLLFSVLRDLLRGPERAACARLVMQGEGPRLQLAAGNRTLSKYVQEPGATLGKRDLKGRFSDVARNVLRLKNHLLTELEQWPNEDLAAFTRVLRTRVLVAVLYVQSETLGRQVFVTTNQYGTPLRPVEMIKSQLAELAASSEEADWIVRRWEALREDVGDLQPQRNRRTDPRRDEGKRPFESFLQAVDMIERGEPQHQAWPAELAAYLKRRLRSSRQAVRWLDGLDKLARSWNHLSVQLKGGGIEPTAQDAWRLDPFWWPEWRPLALIWWRRLADGHEDAPGFFQRFHQRCMALSLCTSDVDRPQIFANAMRHTLRGGDPTKGPLRLRPKQAARLKRTLLGEIRDPDIWVPLFKWMESRDWSAATASGLHSGSVDHLAPKKPVQIEEDPSDYDRMCFSLGNLAMVPWAINKEAGNIPYEEKRPLLLPHAERFWTLADAVRHPIWTAEVVAARRNHLYVEIVRMLGRSRTAALRL